MAKHEKYQVFNPQNKQFVLMKNGEILDNSYFKFSGVPLFGGGPESSKIDPENRPGNDEPAEDNKSDNKTDSESGGGFNVPLFS